MAALAEDPKRARWNQQSLESGALAREFGFADLDGSQPDSWRYMRDEEASGAAPLLSHYR